MDTPASPAPESPQTSAPETPRATPSTSPIKLLPLVRRGEVGKVLVAELRELYEHFDRLTALTARLEEYQALHPERHEHMRRFVEDGVDQP